MKINILVIETEYTRALLKKKLHEQQYVVVAETKSYSEGLNLYKSVIPDIVIIDIDLEKTEKGLSFLAELKKSDPTAQVIALSSFFENETKVKLYKLGIERLVTKPYQPAFIWSEIDDIKETINIIEYRQKRELLYSNINSPRNTVEDETNDDIQASDFIIDIDDEDNNDTQISDFIIDFDTSKDNILDRTTYTDITIESSKDEQDNSYIIKSAYNSINELDDTDISGDYDSVYQQENEEEIASLSSNFSYFDGFNIKQNSEYIDYDENSDNDDNFDNFNNNSFEYLEEYDDYKEEGHTIDNLYFEHENNFDFESFNISVTAKHSQTYFSNNNDLPNISLDDIEISDNNGYLGLPIYIDREKNYSTHDINFTEQENLQANPNILKRISRKK